MSTSIYESTLKENPQASPPSSRRRTAYRREVYGEKAPSPTHNHRHRNHSKKKASLTTICLTVLLIVAGGLVIVGVMSSLNDVSFSNENPLSQKIGSPFSLSK